ncbi:MAG TPA: hypothetical protein VGK94_08125 [Candidatus Polarisedimenticolia bacterium]|jgi:hypothetical protein
MPLASNLVRGHRLAPGALLAVVLSALSPANLARAQEAPKLTFYPSLQLRFVDGQARNYFFSHAGVVNVSGTPMTDLTLRQKFPEGFKAKLISADAQAVFKRPDGFSESIEGNVYTMKLSELRIAEATTLAVELTYQGRPAAVTFPGVEVTYTQEGHQVTEKGLDQTWDLSKYTKYAGTIREFIKRYAGLDLSIPDTGEDWGFSNLAARAAGRIATGAVEIEGDPTGRLRFSIQAGTPGNLRQMILIRKPHDPSRYPKANDEVRRLVMDLVQTTADFTLDGDEFSIQKKRLGRWDAWVAQTRWRDRVKDRLGEGPSRWYLFADEKSGGQYIINISAQGRGVGPGKSDTPEPAREQALMAELDGIVSSIRLIQ